MSETSQNLTARRVLGIDPGSQVMGFGIVEDHGSQLRCIISGTVRTTSVGTLPSRLKILHDNLLEIIARYRPQVMVVESVFQSSHAQSALKLGHARGVALLAAAEGNLQFFEYAPRAIKKGLTGSGAASKDQVQKMVGLLLRGATLPKSLDATDALAVAIYHCHLNPWLRRTGRVQINSSEQLG